MVKTLHVNDSNYYFFYTAKQACLGSDSGENRKEGKAEYLALGGKSSLLFHPLRHWANGLPAWVMCNSFPSIVGEASFYQRLQYQVVDGPLSSVVKLRGTRTITTIPGKEDGAGNWWRNQIKTANLPKTHYMPGTLVGVSHNSSNYQYFPHPTQSPKLCPQESRVVSREWDSSSEDSLLQTFP